MAAEAPPSGRDGFDVDAGDGVGVRINPTATILD